MWVCLFLLRRRPVARVLQGNSKWESRDPPFWWVPFKIDEPPARLLPWPCSRRPNARFLRILQGAGGCQRGGASVAAVRLPHQRANQRQPAGAVGMLRHRRPFWVRVIFWEWVSMFPSKSDQKEFPQKRQTHLQPASESRARAKHASTQCLSDKARLMA